LKQYTKVNKSRQIPTTLFEIIEAIPISKFDTTDEEKEEKMNELELKRKREEDK